MAYFALGFITGSLISLYVAALAVRSVLRGDMRTPLAPPPDSLGEDPSVPDDDVQRP